MICDRFNQEHIFEDISANEWLVSYYKRHPFLFVGNDFIRIIQYRETHNFQFSVIHPELNPGVQLPSEAFAAHVDTTEYQPIDFEKEIFDLDENKNLILRR